ncbi:MAG TPA: N-acetyl-gamma-glutamyl-phosphate reductase [Solirubrobacterales bacterium]|nr:N-acetyl-gamma-glutamyl-phosphate reductase [Solirubrobacterales bacterium]
MSKPRILVAGATGFAGALSARIVHRHPDLELARITSRSDIGARLDSIYPRHRVPLALEELETDDLSGFDGAIVAYPHGAAAPVVQALSAAGVPAVDLSADFRIRDLATYGEWYGDHGAPELVSEAVYGLTELNRGAIAGAGIVANPGCYPTATLLALAPLARAGVLKSTVVDAKSGVSGAGKGGGDFTEVSENVKPYGVDGHRHLPEIEQELHMLGAKGPLTFIPHLLPIDQGLLASCYVELERPFDAEELRGLYDEMYSSEPFVEVVNDPPGVADVRETNYCRIHPRLEWGGERAIVFAAIDNLWKGAASQAVQNLNLMLGLDEAAGVS